MRSLLAAGSMLLVAGTWRLWTPQQLFPRVPLFAFELNWTDGVDAAATWIMLIAWLCAMAALVVPKLPISVARLCSLLYALLFVGLVVLDQHRLQPWCVHIAMCLLIVTAFEERRALSWMLAFTASIYIYSALSKFDAQFLHTVGQDFLAGLLRIWPGSYAGLTDAARLWLAALFPIGELACGLGLLWQPCRRAAMVLAVVMHATLIFILGPWGLAHSWGVLLWNALFIGVNILMWRQLSALGDQSLSWRLWPEGESKMGLLSSGLVTGCLIAMFVLPAGERFGLVDHWLGWALYAPHSSRARIEVAASSVDEVPQPARRFVREGDELSPFALVSVDQWSLQTLSVPIYPQQRFYVAVAQAIAEPLEEYQIRVTLQNTASRFSGARTQLSLDSRTELDRAARRYWFNTQPRS